MRIRFYCSLPILALFVSVVCPNLDAWNAAGHRTIASMIFRRLPDERRTELAELLTHHPRYREDFANETPPRIRRASKERQAEWLLQQASVWPDVIRDESPGRAEYNRPLWHYLPRAFYLTEPSEEFRRQVESGLNSDLEPVGGTGNRELNGPQAFKANLSVLNDLEADKSERAVALCWVLHIGQDLHQPCHTASLYDPDLFPEGDRGANGIKTHQSWNLHAVWDGPLGPDSRYQSCRNLAIIMLGDAPDEVLNQPIESVDKQMEKWLAEGLALERNAVYVGEVREAVDSGAFRGRVDLSAKYLRNVRTVANGRMLNAGVRLGVLLQGPIRSLSR